MKKVIITAPSHTVLIERLKQKGYEVFYEPVISYNKLAELITDVEGLVVTTRIAIDKLLLDKAPKLK